MLIEHLENIRRTMWSSSILHKPMTLDQVMTMKKRDELLFPGTFCNSPRLEFHDENRAKYTMRGYCTPHKKFFRVEASDNSDLQPFSAPVAIILFVQMAIQSEVGLI
ncbi:hypothetical protein NPIL_271221 [Nephila pilipes]|uniref:Uncharacterized protein n=1 Tax=Nephila pilipes TaxID=299642 RepID=A0A8X6QMR1_NEPPI|nr:hypothetical protein NPIL_271221 [Nephila pilipes]